MESSKSVVRGGIVCAACSVKLYLLERERCFDDLFSCKDKFVTLSFIFK